MSPPRAKTASRILDDPVKRFATRSAWQAWLAKNHAKSRGIWLELAKKGSGARSVSRSDALEVALCYGWIDGQGKRFDEQYWLQKFTPRRPKSIWSQINTERAERLIATGEMQPAGLRAIEAAKQDGRWQAAYASQRNMEVPEDFQAALNKNKKAAAFFATLKKGERYSFLFRIQNAKRPETRAKRIEQFVEMLARGEKIGYE